MSEYDCQYNAEGCQPRCEVCQARAKGGQPETDEMNWASLVQSLAAVSLENVTSGSSTPTPAEVFVTAPALYAVK